MSTALSRSQFADLSSEGNKTPINLAAFSDRFEDALKKTRAAVAPPRAFFGPGAGKVILCSSCTPTEAAEAAEAIRRNGVEEWFSWRDRLRQELALCRSSSRRRFLEGCYEPDAQECLLICAFEYGLGRYGTKIVDLVAPQTAALSRAAFLWRMDPHLVSGSVLEQAMADLIRALRADYD